MQRRDQQQNILDLVLSNEADMVDEISYIPPVGKSPRRAPMASEMLLRSKDNQEGNSSVPQGKLRGFESVHRTAGLNDFAGWKNRGGTVGQL